MWWVAQVNQKIHHYAAGSPEGYEDAKKEKVSNQVYITLLFGICFMYVWSIFSYMIYAKYEALEVVLVNNHYIILI